MTLCDHSYQLVIFRGRERGAYTVVFEISLICTQKPSADPFISRSSLNRPEVKENTHLRCRKPAHGNPFVLE